ncbi:MAG: Glycosyl transferase group 1 [Desulfonauticus sp. 38_4375]|nr:MAG: Glycosyl transferase group 1 [Desulfonauticus sp. 38_4375]
MKVLYAVHQFFPKHYTGTERFILNLSKQMQRMGHKVQVLTYGITETEGFSEAIGEFLVKRYIFQGIPVISIRHKVIPEDVSFRIFDGAMGEVLDSILDTDYDVLHIGHPMRVGAVFKFAKNLGLPAVLTLTDFWLICPSGIGVAANGELCLSPNGGENCVSKCYGKTWEERIKQRFKDASEIISGADVIASPTRFLAGVFEKEFSKEIRVVRHGIDYSSIKYIRKNKTNRQVVIGYIGTVLPHKGVHVAIEALKKVDTRNIKLKIWGNYFHAEDYYQKLKELVGDDEIVEFLGEYKDEELNEIMSEADCIIQPSIWWENSPLTVLTALAYRVPVIATNVGGAAELVKDGVNGFNFNIGDPDSLANVLERIANNPEILNRIRENIIRPPRIEEEAFEYEKVYKSLVDK